MPHDPSHLLRHRGDGAETPTVSVAMCTYNGERFLAEQLQSIQQQTRRPDQLVVCDDGSNDSTRDILQTFSQSAPFPITLQFNSINLGVTRNFEQAISLCQSDFIALCDQDDRWHPTKLQSLAQHLVANPKAGFVCSNAALINQHGTRMRDTLWDRWRIDPSMLAAEPSRKRGLHLLRANCVTGATMMIRRDLVCAHALPIPASWVHDHWITMLCEILERPGCTSAELLTEYRQHEGQVLGLSYKGRFSRRTNLAEREREKAASLQRYTDLQQHLEGQASNGIPMAASWLELIRVATEELQDHYRLLNLPWWQRELNRLLRRKRRAA